MVVVVVVGVANEDEVVEEEAEVVEEVEEEAKEVEEVEEEVLEEVGDEAEDRRLLLYRKMTF